MKIVVTADWHAHNFKDFSTNLTVKWDNDLQRYTTNVTEFDSTIELNSRLYNILEGICDMRDYAVANGIDTVLIGGDIFHHRATLDVTVFNSVYRVLDTFQRKYNIQVYAIAGNHDQVDASINPCSSIHAFKNIITVVETPREVYISNNDNSQHIRVIMLPFSKSKEYILQQLEYFKPDKNSILLAHLGVNGGVVGSGMYSMKDEYTLEDLQSDKWKYVVLGHYHQPQLLSYNALYCGSIIQNNFGDERLGKGAEGYNGFFVIDTDKKYSIEFVPIYSPRFITLKNSADLDKFDKSFLETNFIRVKSTDDNYEEIQSKLVDLFGEEPSPVRIEVEKSYEVTHRSDIGVISSPEETISIYVMEKWENPLILNERVITAGLEILEEALGR